MDYPDRGKFLSCTRYLRSNCLDLRPETRMVIIYSQVSMKRATSATMRSPCGTFQEGNKRKSRCLALLLKEPKITILIQQLSSVSSEDSPSPFTVIITLDHPRPSTIVHDHLRMSTMTGPIENHQDNLRDAKIRIAAKCSHLICREFAHCVIEATLNLCLLKF